MPEVKGRDNLWYVLLMLVVLVAALAGYAGYMFYPRFDLPSVTGVGLFLIAAMAGVASFFSPCSFPLLLTLLARAIGSREADQESGSRARVGNAVQYGGALALGATLFLLLVGGGIALGGGALFSQITFSSVAGRVLRLLVGGVLILLGLVQLEYLAVPFDRGVSLVLPLRRKEIELRRRRPRLAFGLFGFGYILSGFG